MVLVTRLLTLLAVLAAPLARAEAPVSQQSGFSIGPDGLSVNGVGPVIRSDGNGSYVMDFSITKGAIGGPPQAPVVLPPISAPASNSLTDPNEFFRGVGKDSAPPPEQRSLRQRR